MKPFERIYRMWFVNIPFTYGASTSFATNRLTYNNISSLAIEVIALKLTPILYF